MADSTDESARLFRAPTDQTIREPHAVEPSIGAATTTEVYTFPAWQPSVVLGPSIVSDAGGRQEVMLAVTLSPHQYATHCLVSEPLPMAYSSPPQLITGQEIAFAERILSGVSEVQTPSNIPEQGVCRDRNTADPSESTPPPTRAHEFYGGVITTAVKQTQTSEAITGMSQYANPMPGDFHVDYVEGGDEDLNDAHEFGSVATMMTTAGQRLEDPVEADSRSVSAYGRNFETSTMPYQPGSVGTVSSMGETEEETDNGHVNDLLPNEGRARVESEAIVSSTTHDDYHDPLDRSVGSNEPSRHVQYAFADEADNSVVCQFDWLGRKRSIWRFRLRHGVLRISVGDDAIVESVETLSDPVSEEVDPDPHQHVVVGPDDQRASEDLEDEDKENQNN
ncbi:unnamed protein product [Mesocestoides corti]|uniref:Uncharacterized protein n=2 Tax=Mesocestoides corti TaxID=53468 RepID=A0A0R3ULW1_MESCO|nr:unnamed protein product [Mesocestoides corti]